MTYSTESGPACGPLLWRQGDHVIGVTGSHVDRRLIGSALQVGSTEGGIAIW
jgi:hypothetical protein